MKRPRTVDEYVDLMHQAVYEVDELRSIMEEDSEEFSPFKPFIDQLDTLLRKMYDDMVSGQYRFDPNGPELPFMMIAKKIGAKLPFGTLLKVIDQTHREGLDVSVK